MNTIYGSFCPAVPLSHQVVVAVEIVGFTRGEGKVWRHETN